MDEAKKNSRDPNHKSKNLNKNEMDQLTSQLANKIAAINNHKKAQKTSRRFFGFKINPFFILVSVILLSFFLIGSIGNQSFEQQIPLSQVINDLKNNEYSQIIIRDDGNIQVRQNEFLIAQNLEESEFELIDSGIEIGIEVEDQGLLEIQPEEAIDLFVKQGLIDSIRSLFSPEIEKVEQVIYGGDFVILETTEGFPDRVLLSISKDEFRTYLADQKILLSDYQITELSLSYYAKELTLDSIQARFDNGQIEKIITIDNLTIAKIDPEFVNEYTIDWTSNIYTFADVLQNEGIDLASDENSFEIVTKNVPAGVTFDTILTLLTIGVFIFLAVVIFRSAQSSGMGIMQFGQSKAKMFFGKKTGTTFKDVAGIDEAREELNEIVDFLKNPTKYRKLGARIPKGILMFGSPGTGKTLLAKAIAGEAGVPFFHTSGSEFEEMLVGAGASRVRDLFAKAKKAAPSLIFIDEIDAVARKRGTRIQSGSTEQTLNQILVEMDGFETGINVIVIAATNRPDVLDPAILRPGRFDRQVRIESPDKDGRLEILKIHGKNKPFEKTVDLERVAKRTIGFTGADLENILNEAAIIAAKSGAKEISMDNIDEAVSKVVLGPAKRSRKRTENELKLVAYHEAGHAILAKFTEAATPVDKISIVSRGNSGGVTMFLPEKDENIISKRKLLADVRVSLGGRAAEEIALDDISTGASGDIEQATRTARQMVQKFGMSNTGLGMVQYGQSMDNQYLGYHYGDSKDFSEDTAKRIDDEIREIINEAYKYAVDLLTKHRSDLDRVAAILMDKEVLDKEEFDKLFEN